MRYAAIVIVFAALPLTAHHSASAEYEVGRSITMQGVVTALEWMNPHGHFFVDVKGSAGSAVNWDVELPPPNALMRLGWKRDDLKPGDQVVADVWLAKDGSHRADATVVTLPDGHTLPLPWGWEHTMASPKR